MKKNKLVFLFAWLALFMTGCSAGEEPGQMPMPRGVNDESISEDSAVESLRQELMDILQEMDAANTRAYELSVPRTIESVISIPVYRDTLSTELLTKLSVFNFVDNRGCAIMSADTILPSLIALTNSGRWNENNTIDHPGLGIYIQHMDKYVSLKTGSLTDGTASNYYVKEYGEWQNTVYKQGGYCPVTWGQRDPYNANCPTKNGKKCPTGCVATALAQYCAINQFPEKISNLTLSWENMISSPKASYCDSVGKKHVARLMAYLGRQGNLNMNYDTVGSSASMSRVSPTLKNLGYSSTGVLQDYDTVQVISELTNGHSILASGSSFKKSHKLLGITLANTYSGGHAWLIHGLLKRTREVKTYSVTSHTLLSTTTETRWYPLCNWGWNGDADGYYYNDVFNTTLDADFVVGTSSTSTFYSLSDISSDMERYYQYKIKMITNIRK